MVKRARKTGTLNRDVFTIAQEQQIKEDKSPECLQND